MKTACLFCLAVIFAACGPTYRDLVPQPKGWRAPDLTASDQWGRQINLKSATSGEWAVVFFYPKADTPGWRKQVKSLQSAFASLSRNKIQVIGVSMDTVAEQRAFSDKFHLTFPLLADTSGVICDAFRIDRPENKPRRETFLFRKGRLVDHNRAVDPKEQANDVLRKIEELR